MGLAGLERPGFTDSSSIRYKLRKKRFEWIEGILHRIIEKRGYVRVLDVGGRANYWRLLDSSMYSKIDVTLMNLEDEAVFGDGAPEGFNFTLRTGNGCDMPELADKEFDLCHSNSVIEHVGSLSAMLSFAKESRRVARMYYHQTPDLAFPLEPHYGVPFFHWLPGPVRARMLTRFKLGYGKREKDIDSAAAIVDHTEIPTSWLMQQLFPDAEIGTSAFCSCRNRSW